ncbi:hypothetical protein CK203_049934 [Vitis vinifera]|uniref:Uncharacterized protein n=1 Tax=Vitis vinifera TaxID=29760 RepID=A0A438GRS5_VITVI|nr:hypothetical protein CK203_049934 [Vitis vinifera]
MDMLAYMRNWWEFSSLFFVAAFHGKVYLEFKVVNIYTIKSGALQIVLQQLPLGCGLIIGPGRLLFSLIIRAVSGFNNAVVCWRKCIPF